jgi:hypothetical protein
LNDALWHFAFNRLAEVNEQLVTGREEIYFGWQFATKAARPLPGYAVRYYLDVLASGPDALHASFAIYRALDTTIAQNPAAQATAAGPAHPGHRRRAQPGRTSRGHDEAGRRRRADPGHPGLRPLGPRGDSGGNARRADPVPGPYRDGTATAHHPRTHAAAHQPLAAGDDASARA